MRHSPPPHDLATNFTDLVPTPEAYLEEQLRCFEASKLDLTQEHEDAAVVTALKLLTEKLKNASPGFETCSLLRRVGPYVRHIATYWKHWIQSSHRPGVLESLRIAAGRSGKSSTYYAASCSLICIAVIATRSSPDSAGRAQCKPMAGFSSSRLRCCRHSWISRASVSCCFPGCR